MTVVVAALAGAWAITAVPRPSYADGPIDSPHGGYTATTDSCSTCHRSHTAQNRELLTESASPQSALCYLCHREAPFQDQSGDSRSDTNFRFHGLHLGKIENVGNGGLDIDTAGAGQGNSICAECHYRVHGTSLAPWSANQSYSRGINFAPNVEPISGQPAPLWSLANKNCTLVCHGTSHNPKGY